MELLGDLPTHAEPGGLSRVVWRGACRRVDMGKSTPWRVPFGKLRTSHGVRRESLIFKTTYYRELEGIWLFLTPSSGKALSRPSKPW